MKYFNDAAKILAAFTANASTVVYYDREHDMFYPAASEAFADYLVGAAADFDPSVDYSDLASRGVPAPIVEMWAEWLEEEVEKIAENE